MMSASKAILHCSFDEHIQIQNALHHLANHHLNLRNWTEICQGFRDKIICDFNDVQYSLYGALYYIVDGFLPMMRVLLNQCCFSNVPNSVTNLVAKFIPRLTILCQGVEVSSYLIGWYEQLVTIEPCEYKLHELTNFDHV